MSRTTLGSMTPEGFEDMWGRPKPWMARDYESIRCPICNSHNGHSLSCATLNVDGRTIEGSVRLNLLSDGERVGK